MTDQVTVDCKSFSDLSLQELYDILLLRQMVFMIEQKCFYMDMDGQDQKAFHLMIRVDGILVAYARLFNFNMPYPGYLSLGRVVNHPDYRNKGYGKRLMLMAIEKITALYGEHPIKIGAQAYMTGFYLALGFRDVGQYYLEEGIPHLKMVRG